MTVANFGGWQRLLRYYQAGIVNTAFGYGLYAAFVAAGLNMFVAQIAAHMLGVAFNYFTYRRHVFIVPASKFRFLASYLVSYFLGLAALSTASHFIASPYGAGLVAVLLVSVVNYFVLKYAVFVRTATQEA